MLSADFYVVEFIRDSEKMYFYNKRTCVHFPDSARKFSTITNAKKTAKGAGLCDFKILKSINGSYLYC